MASSVHVAWFLGIRDKSADQLSERMQFMYDIAPFHEILFDFVGVLIDSEPVWWDVIEAVTRDRSLVPEDGHIERRSGVRVRDTIAGLVEDDDQLVDSVTSQIFAIGEARLSNMALADGAIETIKEIFQSGIPLGLVSSSNTVFLERILRVNEVRPYFSVVVGGDCVAHGKPAPDGYLLAAREVGVSAGDCCAVEDSLNGIRAAVAAGMNVVHFGNVKVSDPEACRRIHASVSTFGELAKILFKV
jgi:beta-phosphoglucomutase-like phosphatase (HAD superfamily)